MLISKFDGEQCMMETHQIRFYKATGQFGFLSNLFKLTPHVLFEGAAYLTAEHAYQYGKFRDKAAAEWAMRAPSAHLVAVVAHGLFAWDIVENWAAIKVDRMWRVLLAKFTQNDDLGLKLLQTGDALLVEDSKMDPFWGIGAKGKGKNVLGKLLMGVRDYLNLPWGERTIHHGELHKCHIGDREAVLT